MICSSTFWNSTPTRSRMRLKCRAGLTPNTDTSPSCGSSRPRMWNSSVVLPQPLGPRTTTRWPRSTSKSSPHRCTEVHLCGLDFEVDRGQRVVVLGPNGCGKTTLLFHILGLLEPQEGEVSVFGVNPARHFNRIRERVGVLFQNVDEQIIAPTVWDDVSFSPRSYGYSAAEVEARVTEALECVGIAHLRHKVCHHLSGGEKRKVALAGALVLNPELLVLDEPFEGLDPASRSDLCELLNRLHRDRGVTLVMATHDVNVVPAMADQVFVLLRGGEIVARGTPQEVFSDPGLLRRSNIEPPALSELFQRLADLGPDLGRPPQ